jgi:hypothetical protein
MADKKISALTASTTPLAGTEVLPIVQSGTTVKVSVANLTAGRPIDTTGVVFGNGSFAASKIYASDANGLIIAGKYGTTNDLLVTDPGGNTVLNIPTLTKNLRLADGNLVIGTSGKGIDFTQDPNPAGMTSELLDDYEEGTWTAAFACTSGSITINTSFRTGSYTKVGRLVTVTGLFLVTSVSLPTGSLSITGLPFTSSSGGDFARTSASVFASNLEATAITSIMGRGLAGTSTIFLSKFNAGSLANLAADVKADSEFYISMSYIV